MWGSLFSGSSADCIAPEEDAPPHEYDPLVSVGTPEGRGCTTSTLFLIIDAAVSCLRCSSLVNLFLGPTSAESDRLMFLVSESTLVCTPHTIQSLCACISTGPVALFLSRLLSSRAPLRSGAVPPLCAAASLRRRSTFHDKPFQMLRNCSGKLLMPIPLTCPRASASANQPFFRGDHRRCAFFVRISPPHGASPNRTELLARILSTLRCSGVVPLAIAIAELASANPSC